MTHTLTSTPRYHQDGWTPDVQAVFLDALIASGSVREAARMCGKPAGSAYKRRAHADGAAFKAEWAAAIAVCTARVRETALDRAFTGQIVPVFYRGNRVGEKLVYNDRLLIALMRLYDAPAYHAERAAAAQAAIAPPPVRMTQAEEIASIEAVFETVRLAEATREAAMAALLLEDAAEAALQAQATEAAPHTGGSDGSAAWRNPGDAAGSAPPEPRRDTRANRGLGVSKDGRDAGENDDPGVSIAPRAGAAAAAPEAPDAWQEVTSLAAAHPGDEGWDRPESGARAHEAKSQLDHRAFVRAAYPDADFEHGWLAP